jgi:hypothetical protein
MSESKTMVQGSKAVGREVPITPSNDTARVPGDYHDFPSIESKSNPNTYESRKGALVEALGNKDGVKG